MDPLDQLRLDYRRSLPDKIQHIEGLWRGLRRQPAPSDAWGDFHTQVHRLAGTGAAYGFPAIGAAARELDSLLWELDRDPRAYEDELDTCIERLLRQLKAALRATG